jgi:hypothetical protein
MEAVGSYVASDGPTPYGNVAPLSAVMENGHWTEVEEPSQSGGSLFGVSCPKVNSCVAVGSGGGLPLIENLADGNWNEVPLSIPVGDSQVDLQSLSCQTTGSCVAVGEEANAGGYKPIVAAAQLAIKTNHDISVRSPSCTSEAPSMLDL